MENISNFFLTSIGQFVVGTLLSLAALISTVLIYIWQRQQKRLSYEILFEANVLSVNEEISGHLEIIYDGTPTRNISLVVVKLSNSGNVPILASDFQTPLSIDINRPAKILSCVIVEREPREIDVTFEQYDSAIDIAPVLLNPGDSFTLKILISDFSKYIYCSARIIGVKTIDDIRAYPKWARLLLYPAGLCIGIATVIFTVGFIGKIKGFLVFVTVFEILAFSLLAIITLRRALYSSFFRSPRGKWQKFLVFIKIKH